MRLSAAVAITVLLAASVLLRTGMAAPEYPVTITYPVAQTEAPITPEPDEIGIETEAYEESRTSPPRYIYFPLDLNTATVEELSYIPGVGATLSSRIAAYRERLGGYDSLEQLLEIRGIGEVTFENISAYLYVD